MNDSLEARLSIFKDEGFQRDIYNFAEGIFRSSGLNIVDRLKSLKFISHSERAILRLDFPFVFPADSKLDFVSINASLSEHFANASAITALLESRFKTALRLQQFLAEAPNIPPALANENNFPLGAAKFLMNGFHAHGWTDVQMNDLIDFLSLSTVKFGISQIFALAQANPPQVIVPIAFQCEGKATKQEAQDDYVIANGIQQAKVVNSTLVEKFNIMRPSVLNDPRA